MDDITLLSSRFHALMDKVQGLIDELHASPVTVTAGGKATLRSRPDTSRKAYTIRATGAHDERRQKALIKVIDDVLKQIDHAVSSDAEAEPRRESGQRALFEYEKKLFTLEELRFLETTLRTFHPAAVKEAHPDS
ncbi:hypothetical protein [Desulfoluna limicola]|nr:hypothetical protein [Desulfoluna limicola]